jgi:hypothetical protein
MRVRWAAWAMVLMLGGCGGAPDGEDEVAASHAPDSGHGTVARSAYEGDGIRVVFATERKAQKTWAQMVGGVVEGFYVERGDEIEVHWDSVAAHHGSLSEKFRQNGPCTLTRYERVDRLGVRQREAPQSYRRSEPACDAAR